MTLTPVEWSKLKEAATLHATTKQGSKEIRQEIKELTSEEYYNSISDGLITVLQEALNEGLREREIIQETKRQIRIAKNLGSLNPESTSKASKRSLNRALTSIQVATTLGAEISAPVGTSAYMLSVAMDSYDSSMDIVGAYPTKELAEVGLANWIIRHWDAGFAAPWHNDHPNGREFYLDDKEDARLWEIAKVNYLHEKSTKDIIEEYVAQSMSGPYKIQKIVVKGE